ncbi:Tim44/TimA family putative adaptor protein [Mesorhizobium sp. M0166]|uniref:Tim44/TimA family putative adaptor protein n=1 Tax=Mesorhizobium sp. M0166 TaxID=2956902 RepID=UPI00333BB66F
MNETTDPNNQILLVAIVAFYWALLAGWDQLLPRSDDDKTKRGDAVTEQRSGVADYASSAGQPLDVIRDIDPNFDLAAFLTGAKTAYEVILRAYADGDIQTLKRLVGPEVLETFERAIAGRRDREETLQLTLIGVSEAKVIEALEENGTAEIGVRFVSEVVSVTRSANDRVVAGDPTLIVEVIDTWTFARETQSTKRDWVLIATEGD